MAKDFLLHSFVYFVFVMLIFGALVFSRGQVTATNSNTPEAWQYQITATEPIPDIPGYIVMDEATGEVLLAEAPDVVRPTASVIKLVVAAAALQSNLLDATTTITWDDVGAPEDFGKLAVGEVYTLYELLFPYLMESSNDAGAAIERTWGPDLTPIIFTLLTAAGVEDSVTVADFNGLDTNTSASPAALATLARYLSNETPSVFDITLLPQYLGQHPLVNNSPLRADETYRGGKHGYTPAAGKTALVRLATTFSDGERNLIIVSLGAPDSKMAVAAIKQQIKDSITRVPQTSTDSAILPAS